MRARLVVFPVKGRNWCFSRSVDPLASEVVSSHTPSTFKQLWHRIYSSNNPSHNAQLLIDFISNKMNKAWVGLEKAPEGTFKKKIHGVGLKLLARVKPSEIFLKSISREVTDVEVTYPSSLNARLVRRRLRHIAMRGTIIHKKYFYGSVSLIPLTSALSVLPLPNIPFFWVLFRTYSHWRAFQGSEKLLQLVSDHSQTQKLGVSNAKTSGSDHKNSKHESENLVGLPWVLKPSKELDQFVGCGDKEEEGLDKSAISDICKKFDLNKNDVLKYKNSM